jgi:hypothetical protein
LPIEDRAFIGKLLDTVPCRVGGEYLYFDPVRIVATIANGGSGLSIESVVSGVVISRGREFAFEM